MTPPGALGGHVALRLRDHSRNSRAAHGGDLRNSVECPARACYGSAPSGLTVTLAMRQWRRRAGGALCVALSAIGGIAAHAAQPIRFDCRASDGRCPQLTIAGDPTAAVPGYGPAPFRGVADPSLRLDPRTNTLWLSYSWVSTSAASGILPGRPMVDIGVGIHLARSDDGGRHFRYVRSLWSVAPEIYEGRKGYAGYEVSTLSPTPGGWAGLSLRYFNPRGHGNDFVADSLHFELAEGPDPERLEVNRSIRLAGALGSRSWRPFVNLSQLARANGACPLWTEPSLYQEQGVLYMLAQCKWPRNPDKGYLGLFARRVSAWQWVGRIAGSDEAAALGGNELTQADLARARDGSLILIVTPNLIAGGQEHHLGCAIMTIVSLDPPKLRLDASGAPLIRAWLTSSDSVSAGPGACAYDPASPTGVLLVRRQHSPPGGLIFSIHRTGVHP